MATHSRQVFLPGKAHEQRSLAGDGPQGRKESDTIEVPEHTPHLVSIISLHVYLSLCMFFSVVSVVPDSVTSWKQPTSLLYPWDSPGKNPGVGCHSFSRASSCPRNRTHVSCVSYIAGEFFTAESPGKPLSQPRKFFSNRPLLATNPLREIRLMFIPTQP